MYNRIINSIENNSIIFSDIDDTILFFDLINPQWWIDKFEKYYKQTNSYDLADLLSLNEWETHICYNIPHIKDKNGFDTLIKKINITGSTLIFITSRNIKLNEITINNFMSAGFYDILKYKIIYTNGESKSTYIKNILEENNYNKIIFMDDLEENINDVSMNIENVNVYKI